MIHINADKIDILHKIRLNVSLHCRIDYYLITSCYHDIKLTCMIFK